MPPEYGDRFTFPGELLTLRMESLAPEALSTRLRDYADEIGLTDEQVRVYSRLSREYHDKQMDLRVEFALCGDAVKLTAQPLTAAGIAERRTALHRRAALLLESETAYFQYTALGQELFTEKQWARLVEIYVEEKRAALAQLQVPLAATVGPVYELAARGPVSGGDRTMVTSDAIRDHLARPSVTGLPVTEPSDASDLPDASFAGGAAAH